MVNKVCFTHLVPVRKGQNVEVTWLCLLVCMSRITLMELTKNCIATSTFRHSGKGMGQNLLMISKYDVRHYMKCQLYESGSNIKHPSYVNDVCSRFQSMMYVKCSTPVYLKFQSMMSQ
jgi:hypothetical protein